jgi:glycosyltransferase involved in cell wall biosynthesis
MRPAEPDRSGITDRPHLVHVFSTFAAAGPQIRTVRLIEALGKRFAHTIVPVDGRREALELLPASASVACVDPPARARGPLAVHRMHALLGTLEPDLLLTYNWGSFDAVLAACLRPGLRLLHHEDGFNADEALSQKRRRVLARRLFLRRAAKVVVPSQRLATIAKESWGIPASKLELVPNGIDLERFVPRQGRSAVRADLGIPAEAFVIGAVGHLRAVKNFARCIEACASVPEEALGGRELHLVLAGDGPERPMLEQRARERFPTAGRVHFAGHRTELVPWYQAMDVFALSSDSEQHPVALIEAMACGLPVAATDVGDVRLVLPEEQHAHLVALGEGDARALGRSIAELASDRPRRERLGALNRSRAKERYSFATMLARYAKLYAELLERP